MNWKLLTSLFSKVSKFLPLISASACFIGGFYFRSLLQNKADLKQEIMVNKAIFKSVEISEKHGEKLELDLDKVKIYEKTITQKAISQKTNRHDANSYCLDDDFIKLYNEQSKAIEAIISNQHNEAVQIRTTNLKPR